MTEATARLLQDSPNPDTPFAVFCARASNYFEPPLVCCHDHLPDDPPCVDAGDKKGGARYELLPFDINSNPLGLNPAGLWR